MAAESCLTARPPVLPDDLCAPPSSILLDPYGYISDRTNATTADGFTRDGKRIKVTFWVARPPHGSYFTFCSPDLETSAFADVPCIVSTEDDLVLIRFPICRPTLHLNPRHNSYFVYQAGGKDKPPSLELIPSPPSMYCSDYEVGLLPCRTLDMYFVAILQPVLSREGLYKLYLYSSKMKAWATKMMHLNQNVGYRVSSKVITIGGEHGSLGWVDLWQGILVCDVLLDNHELRYISLPPARVAFRGPPLRSRDIIVCDGCIKLLKMDKYIGPDGVTKGWQVAIFVWRDSLNSWADDCSIKFTEDLVLPCLWKSEPIKQLTLKGLYSGYPALSLHDSDVIYIMDRQDFVDKEALVIAVDLRKHILTGVTVFRSGRPLGYNSTYRGSRISKYCSSTSRGNPCADESTNTIGE